MSNYAKLYWLTRLDYLQGMFLAVSVIIVLALVFYSIVHGVIQEEWPKRKYFYIWLPILFVTVLIANLIPTQKEAILIIAGGKTIEFVQGDTSINKIPHQTTAIISQFLENQIKELKEEK